MIAVSQLAVVSFFFFFFFFLNSTKLGILLQNEDNEVQMKVQIRKQYYNPRELGIFTISF